MENKKYITVGIKDLEGFKEYLIERENSAATVQKYMTDIRTFYRFLGRDKRGDKQCRIDKQHLIGYKTWLLDHYAVSSANSMIAALNQFLVYAGAGLLRLRRIRVQRQLFAVQEKEMSREEYRKLIAAANTKGKQMLALLIETICATGIRVSELPYFTVENVKSGRIQVRNKGKMRYILIPVLLKAKLMHYIQRAGITRGYIFRTRSGQPKDRSNIWSEMKALHEEAGIDPRKIFPHNLRHLFAKVYYAATKDFAGLADILGHSSLEVTRIYAAPAISVYQGRIESLGLCTG